MGIEHLSGQFWGPGGLMFHISDTRNRESIMSKGLVPRGSAEHPEGVPQSNRPTLGESANIGSYVSEEPHQWAKDQDVYVVDTSYLPSLTDEKMAMDRVLRSRYIPGAVSPDRVHLLNEEEKNTLHSSKVQYRWKNPFDSSNNQ